MKVKLTRNTHKIKFDKKDYLMKLEDLEIYNKILKYEDYVTIKIIPDGNCAYRVISYFYQNNQENHLIIRNLTYEWIKEHKQQFIFAFSPEENEQNITVDEKFEIYLNNIKKEGTWTGDVEFSAIAKMFNINIAIYILKINEYVNYAFYYSCNNFVDIIRINFIDRNHFELLCHKDDKILIGEYANNINKEELKNKYVNKIKNNNSLITTNEIKENIKFPNKYVAYNNKYVPNEYNEIYIYLK